MKIHLERQCSLSKDLAGNYTRVLSASYWLGPISDSRHWPRVLFNRPSLPQLEPPRSSWIAFAFLFIGRPACPYVLGRSSSFLPAFSSSFFLSLIWRTSFLFFSRRVTVSRIKYSYSMRVLAYTHLRLTHTTACWIIEMWRNSTTLEEYVLEPSWYTDIKKKKKILRTYLKRHDFHMGQVYEDHRNKIY